MQQPPHVRSRPIRVHLACYAAALIWCAAVPVHAEVAELVTDRPDQTESAAIVPRGAYQLEGGWQFDRDDEAGLRLEAHTFPSSLLRVGLTDPLELRVGWGGLVREELTTPGSELDVDGATDASLGIKLKLRDERGSAPQAALIVATTVPVGDDELSSDRFDPELRAAVSRTLTEKVGIGANVGVAWESVLDGSGRRTTESSYLYTVAAGFALSETVGTFVELFGTIPGSADGGPQNSFDAGVTWLLQENLQLDAAAGVGLSDDAGDWFVGLGVSVRWPE